MPSPAQARTARSRTLMLAFCGFLVVAVFFLAAEHRAHALAALPYALLLVCPLLHFWMHRGHRRDHSPTDHASRSER